MKTYSVEDLLKENFKECKECASKPGSPSLCQSCYDNRSLISRLQNELNKRVIREESKKSKSEK